MKTMKLNMYKVLLATSVVLLVLTPIVNHMVNFFIRSQSGFGSECLLWILPIVVLGLLDTISI